MKILRQLCAATILCLTLALSAFAGHIDCPGVVSPPPPPSETTISNITTTMILAIIGLIR